MTTIDTTALRALAEKATPGPWEAEYSGEQGNCVLPPDARSTREAVACTRLLDAAADARFVAAFHPGTALALLDEVEALRAQVERVRAQAEETISSLTGYPLTSTDHLALVQARATLALLDGEVAD